MSEDANWITKGPSTYERLSARFATEVHKRVNKGGGDQTYVPASDVIARLNDVLGVDGWSFRVIREGFTETEAWVLGELTVYHSESSERGLLIRQQYGNELIVSGKAQRPVTDLLKKAGTDALKKCATLVGVALYLYDEDERNEVEAEMREAKRPKVQTGNAATPAAGRTSPESRSASTPSAASAAPSSSSTPATPARSTPKVEAAAVVGGADPTVLKTQDELVADLKKGLEYARSLGLDPKDVDGKKLNRAELEETINSLRQQCREVLAEQRRQGMVV